MTDDILAPSCGQVINSHLKKTSYLTQNWILTTCDTLVSTDCVRCIFYFSFMITSWNGNIFRVAGHLCEESTGHRLITSTKASDVELWRFRWSASEINGWVINREVGDYGRLHAYHYVIVTFNLNRIVWQAGRDNASKPYLGALFVCLLSELPAVVLLLAGNY